MKTIKKRKVLIVTAEMFAGGGGFIPIDIQLPANVKKVTGILVTARERFGG